MKTVVFRTDGNKSLGIGHFVRCSALASAFCSNGYQVVFAVSDNTLKKQIHNLGFGYVCVDSKYDNYDFHSNIFYNYVKKIMPCLVVVDNYSVSSNYLSQIRKLTKVLFISEYYEPDIVRSVDYFLNYNIYMDSIEPIISDGVQMLGTKFTLLREEFSKPLRDTLPDRKTITVLTGGSDTLNIAPMLIQRLTTEKSLNEYHILAVAGALNPNIPELIKLAENCNRIEIAIEPSSVSEIMDNTTIAISSGGSTLYELCARGIPSISYCVAQNQEKIVQEFSNRGIIPYAGDMMDHKKDSLDYCVQYINDICSSISKYIEISHKMERLCNRDGASLVVHRVNV